MGAETFSHTRETRQILITSNASCQNLIRSIFHFCLSFSSFFFFLRFFHASLPPLSLSDFFFFFFGSEWSTRSLRIPVDYSGNLLVCRTAVRARHLAQRVNYKKQTRHVNHRYQGPRCPMLKLQLSRGYEKMCPHLFCEALNRTASLASRSFRMSQTIFGRRLRPLV